MKQIAISNEEVNAELVKGLARAVTGTAGFAIGKSLQRITGEESLPIAGLLVGSAFGALLLKQFQKTEKK